MWDLGYVASTGKWLLVKPDPPHGLPVLLQQQKSGTIVLWEQLDRVVSDAPATDEAAHARFLAVADAVKQHLAMVFHRFLERGKFKLFFNDNPVTPWDPFLKGTDGALPAGGAVVDEPGGQFAVTQELVGQAVQWDRRHKILSIKYHVMLKNVAQGQNGIHAGNTAVLRDKINLLISRGFTVEV